MISQEIERSGVVELVVSNAVRLAPRQILPASEVSAAKPQNNSDVRRGLLMNFNSTALRAGLRRLDHPDRYVKKTS